MSARPYSLLLVLYKESHIFIKRCFEISRELLDLDCIRKKARSSFVLTFIAVVITAKMIRIELRWKWNKSFAFMSLNI